MLIQAATTITFLRQHVGLGNSQVFVVLSVLDAQLRVGREGLPEPGEEFHRPAFPKAKVFVQRDKRHVLTLLDGKQALQVHIVALILLQAHHKRAGLRHVKIPPLMQSSFVRPPVNENTLDIIVHDPNGTIRCNKGRKR